MNAKRFGWLGIARLGLVQAALGSIVVLTTSTMNRVMVVELALPATLPGLLVALHYFVQVMRPRMGHGSDVGGRRTPWIIGGMGVLAMGGVGAALATAVMETHTLAGIGLAVLAFTLIGLGVGASGTSLLVLLAAKVDARRRPAAATVTWLMMIFGFIVTTAIVGQLLDPFTTARLVTVTAGVATVAFVVTVLAVRHIEGTEEVEVGEPETNAEQRPAFFAALRQVWSESESRRLCVFIFVSMLAYSAQDLILEPFAGAVFGLTPGESTKLSSVQNGGVLLGMILVGFAGTTLGQGRARVMRGWTISGCFASSVALLALAFAGFVGPAWPLRTSVFVLGMANGAFAVAAIGSMMSLVSAGRARREGVRMGMWGAAQAIAFALGGLAGTAAVDLSRWLLGSPAAAYASVFAGEALLFLVAGILATRLQRGDTASFEMAMPMAGTFSTGARQQ